MTASATGRGSNVFLPPGEHWPVVTWTEPEPVAPSADQPLVTQSRKSQLSLGEARAVAGCTRTRDEATSVGQIVTSM